MSFVVRMSILGFLLVVALCGLAWEFLVAVPGFNNAQAKLTEIADANIRKTIEESATMKDIREILPQKPSVTDVIKPPKKEGEDDKSLRAMTFIRHDTYKYFHALPWKKPETIVVVYQKVLKSEDELDADPDSFDPLEWRLRTVHFNVEPPKTAQRNVSKDAKNPGDVPMAAGGGGGGGPRQGGGGGRGGGGGGQRPDPEQIFKDNDKDKDGKLTGDEIPERMRRFVDNMDTDKDGSITIEEMKAAVAAMGQRGGGRGGRGGDNKSGKGGRPSFDEDSKEKADPKSEEKSDTKAEEKTEVKPVEKSDAKAEEKAAPKSEEKSDAKPAEKTEAKAEEKADPKAEEKTEEKSDKADEKK